MIPLLRQMALSITPSGVIGVEDSLVFTNSRDMQNFSSFTARTAMIAGRATANQILAYGVAPKATRPLIVVSSTGNIVSGKRGFDHIYFARNLGEAVDIAENLANVSPLTLGWTIVGGKSIYDEALASKLRLNQVYLHQYLAEPDPATPNIVKLNLTSNGVRENIVNRMINCYAKVENYGTKVACFGTPIIERMEVISNWFSDAEEFDDRNVRMMGGYMMCTTAAESTVSVDLGQVCSWTRRNGVDAIELVMKMGRTVEIRPKGSSKQAVNAIEMCLMKQALPC